MLVTQTHMFHLVANQNDELIYSNVLHAPTSESMEYGVEMSSLHLDLAKCSSSAHALTMTHTCPKIKHAIHQKVAKHMHKQ